ncbi:MAG: hypothetical protein HY843_03115 [Bdellovibrio sp.]|nr:hypothetical protein [Bdellovibrio sp.]
MINKTKSLNWLTLLATVLSPIGLNSLNTANANEINTIKDENIDEQAAMNLLRALFNNLNEDKDSLLYQILNGDKKLEELTDQEIETLKDELDRVSKVTGQMSTGGLI